MASVLRPPMCPSLQFGLPQCTGSPSHCTNFRSSFALVQYFPQTLSQQLVGLLLYTWSESLFFTLTCYKYMHIVFFMLLVSIKIITQLLKDFSTVTDVNGSAQLELSNI